MKEFNYWSVDSDQPKFVLHVMADNITDADAKFQAVMGKHPAKVPAIVVKTIVSLPGFINLPYDEYRKTSRMYSFEKARWKT